MGNWQYDVIDFHRKFAPERIGDVPKDPGGRAGLLLDLIKEEYDELADAMVDGDMPDTADAMADLIYVVLGAATTCGIDLGPVWDAVHAANMAKIGGSKRTDGKVLKPEGWESPDIEGVLRRQPPLAHIYPLRGESAS